MQVGHLLQIGLAFSYALRNSHVRVIAHRLFADVINLMKWSSISDVLAPGDGRYSVLDCPNMERI